jgi:putative spermidine/putrescine transport system substrate-binding protein
MGEMDKKWNKQSCSSDKGEPHLSRRDVIKGGTVLAATLGITPLLAGYGGGVIGKASAATAAAADPYPFPDLSGKTITFVDYGGAGARAMEEAYTRPFAEGTKVTILHDAPFEPAKVKAQVEANQVTWDVVNGDPLTSISFCNDGLLEPLDPSLLEGIDPKYHSGTCVVPVDTYASVLAYDSSKFADNPPTSWADYFDTKKYPGKRGMWTAIYLNQLEIALLGDGVAPADLYPLDIDRAIAKLDSIKGDIIFYDSLSQSQEQMVAQSVVMSNAAAQRARAATDNGAPFKPVWNQAVLAWECYGIPKGSPNKEAAVELLKYMATPEAQSRVAGLLGMGSTSKNPVPVTDLSANQQLWLPSTENTKDAVTMNPEWWATHYDEAVAKFTAWIAG